MSNIPEFTCPVCGQSKPLTDTNFYSDKKRANGFKPICKSCSGHQLRKRFIHPVADQMSAAGFQIVAHMDDLGLLRIEFRAEETATFRTLRPVLTDLAAACDLQISAFGPEYRTSTGAFVVFFTTTAFYPGTIAQHGQEVRNHG